MKQKVKKVTKTMMALIITFSILLVSLIGLTVAYFTDNKSYTGTLEFGNVKLKVTDGSDAEMTDGGKITFAFGRENATKLMPGDTVTINFKVSLQDSSEPAYYLVSLTDTKGVFASNTYFSDGTNSYRVDTTENKVYKIATDGTETEETTKKVGELNTSVDKHTFTIKAEIDPAYETQGGKTEVSLNIFAIQQANIKDNDPTNTDKSAYHILTNKINLAVNGVSLLSVIDDEITQVMGWQKALADNNVDYSQFKTVSFYKTSEVPSTLTYNEAVTKTNDSLYDANDINKGKIKIYTNGTEELAFVSDYKIQAPENCYLYYAPISKLLADEDTGAAITKFNFNNFCIENVVNMSGMFAYCSSLTSLDLTDFDTSKVTDMSSMFSSCSSLTSLDVSKFDTSKVTKMGSMFNGCSSLTSLNISSFDTNNVTNMESMFYNCSSLTGLNLRSFDTSSVTNMYTMFKNCSSLTRLDLSNFDISSVITMDSMFNNCSSLTSLDLSNFDTSKVISFTNMFYNTFKNSPNTSTLIISDKFVIDGVVATSDTLNSETSFNKEVTLKIV